MYTFDSFKNDKVVYKKTTIPRISEEEIEELRASCQKPVIKTRVATTRRYRTTFTNGWCDASIF